MFIFVDYCMTVVLNSGYPLEHIFLRSHRWFGGASLLKTTGLPRVSGYSSHGFMSLPLIIRKIPEALVMIPPPLSQETEVQVKWAAKANISSEANTSSAFLPQCPTSALTWSLSPVSDYQSFNRNKPKQHSILWQSWNHREAELCEESSHLRTLKAQRP